MNVILTTDNKWRETKQRPEVPKSVLKRQFDWMMPESIRGNPNKIDTWCRGEFDEDSDTGDYYDGFFKYNNTWYHLSNYMRFTGGWPDEFKGWDGYENSSMSTGTVIKISPDGERYKVGSFRTT